MWLVNKETKQRDKTKRQNKETKQMPKVIHDKLVKEANKKGLTGKRRKAYIYGTLQAIEKRRNKD